MKSMAHTQYCLPALLMLFFCLGAALPVWANPMDMSRYGMIWSQNAQSIATEDFAYADEVFLNGGADTVGRKLAWGYYYVTITTDARGACRVARSYPAKPVFVTPGGIFSTAYKLLGPGGIFPAFTPQQMTEYYVWISKNPITNPPCYAEVDRCRFQIINEPGPTLHVYKFWDHNANGVWDVGAPDNEPPIANWKITITDGTTSETMFTDATGAVHFAVTRGTIYAVSEEDQAGWRSTTPETVIVKVPDTGDSWQISFGNITIDEEKANLMVYTFWDKNCNGVWDAGAPDYEPPLADAEITVEDIDLHKQTQKTDANGMASFRLFAGIYRVIETELPGYLSTTPDQLVVRFEGSGKDKSVYFGDTTE